MDNSKPIRILIIDGKLICGGVESFLMNIYRHLDRERVQFDFLVHYRDEFYYDNEVKQMGGKIYRLSFRNDKNILKYKKDLKNFFRSHPEYQIVWGHMDGLASIYLKIAKECGVKTTICHSHITNAENNLKGFIKRIIKTNTWKYCDYRFACSTEAGRYLYGEHEFKLMPNAIDVKQYSYNKNIRNRIRDFYGWNNKIVIGHIGRFSPQKNHTFLIEVFNQIAMKNKEYVLCLCGDGDDRKKIEELVYEKGLENKVVFTGNISNVNDYYQAFDLFVMPSIYEGLPVSGIEAQTSGLKCFFSNCITSEVNIVKENVAFLPIEKKDVNLWASEIEKNSSYVRIDQTEKIIKAGYSIQELSNEITDMIEGLSND